MRKITIKDIAIALNKSQSTVSKALAGREDVSAETKKLIIDYATKFNFQKNKFGSSLRTGKSKLIGVLLPDITDKFSVSLLSELEDELSETDYNFILMQSKGDINIEKRCIDKLFDRGIDGLIILQIDKRINSDRLKELENLGLPIIMIDRHIGQFLGEVEELKVNNSRYSTIEGIGRKAILQVITNCEQK